MSITKENLCAVIEKNSTKKYYIEHHKWRSNHVSHGIVALYKLGADETRMTEFVERCGAKCEPAEKWGSNEPIKELDQSTLTTLLGSRTNYYELLHYYKHRLAFHYNGSIHDLVAGEFPKMADGLHVAALHPLIQCGYGLSVANDVMVTEAMAYFHISYFPHAPIKAFDTEDQKDIIQVLADVRADDDLYESMITKQKNQEWMPWYEGSFQRKLGILVADTGLFDAIQKYVSLIQLPQWFNKENAGIKDVRRLMGWALEAALTAYVCAEKRNDFFLLHGVTGAWALTQVLEVIEKPQQAFQHVHYFLCILIGAYLAQDRPQLHLTYLEASSLVEMTMEDIRKEVLGLAVDEHVYKMVHICFELSQKPDSEDSNKLIKAASRVAIDYKF